MANSVYDKTNAVRQRLSVKELGQVYNYPQDRIFKMTETKLTLLTREETIPGKIIHSSLYFILSLNERKFCTSPAPKKRTCSKERFDDSGTPNKRCKLKGVFEEDDQVSPMEFEDNGLEDLEVEV